MTRVLVRDCVIAAAEVWGVTAAMIEGPRRWRSVVEARQAAAWLAAQLTGQSGAQVARRIGRERSTIEHAIARIEARLRSEAALADALRRAEALALAAARAPHGAIDRQEPAA